MKRIMQNSDLILLVLIAYCAITAGEKNDKIDKDELWDLVVNGRLNEIITQAHQTSGLSVDSSVGSVHADTLPNAAIDGGNINYDDADSGTDESLFTSDLDSTTSKVSGGDDSDWYGDTIGDGERHETDSGQDWDDEPAQGDDPSMSSTFDKEIIDVLRKRPESRELLGLFGLLKEPTDTGIAGMSLEEAAKSMLLPIDKRKQFALSTIAEEDDLPETETSSRASFEQMGQAESLLSEQPILPAPRLSSVLLQNLNQTLSANRDAFLPPQEGQRSLVIVFDATGSMFDDLKQLRDAAQRIIDEITKRDQNPIYNYVFVPFRDPMVGPRLVTRSKDDLMDALAKLQIAGGGDCPEAALAALESAIEAAMPNSFVFVFTDATAKDFRLDERVLKLVQRKQTPITFLLTGFCNEEDARGHKVMHEIAAASNGQVFDLRKDQLEEVLLGIRSTMDIKHVPLQAIDSPKGKTHDIDFTVDNTLKEFSVSVAGHQPNIEIIDPDREPYERTRDVLSLDNIKVVNVADPAPGKWNIKAGSNSSHSVRLSGISDVRFRFGFSLIEPYDIGTLTHQPVLDAKNIFAIEPSHPELIDQLDTIIVTSHDPDTTGPKTFEFKLPLTPVPGHKALYRTEAFDSPRQRFKITVTGKDIEGRPLKRLLSTAIQAAGLNAPEIFIGLERVDLQEGQNLTMQCHVSSPVPVHVGWKRYRKQLLSKDFNQTNVLSLNISQATMNDAGNYTCWAKNSVGMTERFMLVQVLSRPQTTVRLLPSEVVAIENEPLIVLRCIVQNADPRAELRWTHNGRQLDYATGRSYLELYNLNVGHAGVYGCQTESLTGDTLISGVSTVVVKYSPKVRVPSLLVTKQYGSPTELDCAVEGLPEPEFRWYYQTMDQSQDLELYVDGNKSISFDMAPSKEGLYVCEGSNVYGMARQTYLLQGSADEPPFIERLSEDIIFVAPGDTVRLNCSCELCQPLNEYIWTSHRGTFESSPEEAKENAQVTLDNDQSRNAVRYFLTIANFSLQDEGSYTCILSNDHGADSMIMELRLMIAPSIEGLAVDGEPADGQAIARNGQITTLTCEISGLPEPLVEWRREGQLLSNGYDYLLENDNKTLRFPNGLTQDIQGFYECMAVHPLGTEKKGIDITIGHPPEAASGKLIRAKVGENVTLVCDISGIPEPAISWSAEQVFADPRRREQQLTASYQRAGLYKCSGENPHGVATYVARLDIYGGPEIDGTADEYVQIGLGGSTDLECFATGNPEPTISWTFSKGNISTVWNAAEEQHKLSIVNGTYDHHGTYTCNAANEFEQQQKVFYVSVREIPRITSQLVSRVTLLPENHTTLECSGIGSPPPAASWHFNGSLLQTNEMLYLSHRNASTGLYTCVLQNEEGIDRQNVPVVVVNPPTKVGDNNSIENSTIHARIEEPLKLVCPFDNYDSLMWQLNERNLDEYFDLTDINLKDNLLTIESLRQAHSGTYTCFVENAAGRDRHSFIVGILSPPVIQQTHPDELSYGSANANEGTNGAVEVNLLAGESLQLVCHASGSPQPSVYWSKREQVVSQNSHLVIPNVGTHHGGQYTCVAENELGQSRKVYHLDVMTSPRFYGDPSSTLEVFAGESLSLDCTMQANPAATYQWSKDQFALEEFDTQLKFVNVQPQDSGVYLCEADNAFGENQRTFHVAVYQPPEITLLVPNVTVLEGDKLTLDCEAFGNPIPVLSIVTRGEVVASTSELTTDYLELDQTYPVDGIFQNNPQLHGFYATKLSPYELRFSLRQPKASILDKGRYLCMAQNSIGSDERSVDVDVQVSPYVQTHRLRSTDAIKILEKLPLFLFCPIDGSPKPMLSWYRNSKRLKQSGSTLFIPVTRQRDSGRYTCVGENVVGKQELVFSVDILVPPTMITSDVFGEDHVSDERSDQEEISVFKGDNVTLDCTSIGNPTPEVFWTKVFYLDETQNEPLESKEPTIELYHVERTTTVTCYVNNTAGSVQKLFHVVVQSEPQWKESNYEQNPSVALHHSLDLKCETIGLPEAAIAWTKENRTLDHFEDGYFLSQNGNTLRILAARPSDAGIYKCEASNIHGRLSRDFNVSITVPVSWSPWGVWSSCSVTCGKGTQYRSRICLLLNGSPAQGDQFTCTGENVQMKNCELLPCPINGAWGDWTIWSDCSLDCVTEYTGVKSIRYRSRKCDSPQPSLGGKPCVGEEYEEEPCHVKYCPVDGGWTPWTEWTPCSESCGFGRTLRWRSCTSPAPRYGGKSCEGVESELKTCKSQECNVDGGWSDWTPWSACSKTCGVGSKFRKRFCNNPEPKNTGRPCVGENSEIVRCKVKQCSNDALLRNIHRSNGKRDFTPILTYDTMPVSEQDTASSDYDESSSGERGGGFQVVRSFQYAKGAPVEYVDLPEEVASPSGYHNITVTLKNTVQLSNNTAAFNLNLGSTGALLKHECMVGTKFDLALGKCVSSRRCDSDMPPCTGPGQVCVDTRDSYVCQCAIGYRSQRAMGLHCVDINECREGSHDCSHFCTNNEGGYSCYCPTHYLLTEDRKTCSRKRKRDEPVYNPRNCPDGFYRFNNSPHCFDVDECNLFLDECSLKQTCLNTRGSYLCLYTSCPIGYNHTHPEQKLCTKYCGKNLRNTCEDNVLIGQTFSYRTITIPAHESYDQLLRITIPATFPNPSDFRTYFLLRNATPAFRLKSSPTSGEAYLSTTAKFQRKVLYKVPIVARLYHRSTHELHWVHDIIYYVYWG